MATTTRRKVTTDRYRLCQEGKGSTAVICTAATIEDIVSLIATDGEWVMVAQGVDGLRIDGVDCEIRDRDVCRRDQYDRPKTYGLAAESYSLCRRDSLTTRNPRADD